MHPFGRKSIEKLRAEEAAAHEQLRQASAACDPTLPKDELLFLLQPFAHEVHRAQEALWERLPHDELEAELQRRRQVLHALPLTDRARPLAMVAVADLDRFLHPRRPTSPPAPPSRRRWIVAGVVAVIVFVVFVGLACRQGASG